MWKVLILSAVDDETVCLEVEFVHEALGGGIQVSEEGGVFGIKFRERLHLPFGENEHMKLVAG